MEEETQFDLFAKDEEEELDRIYRKLLTKEEGKKTNKNEEKRNTRKRSRSRSRSRDRGLERVKPANPHFTLKKYEMIQLNVEKFAGFPHIQRLPVYKMHAHVLETILTNQVTLITGETGCGKSTQVPRILYEYLKATNLNKKVLCVQPRRLAAINLTKILGDQLQEFNVASYQIGMENTMSLRTRILYMTNGIFLQRLIHSPRELFNEYPFVILDEVHERDIDTDFILLAMMHLLQEYPQLRVILMSATIDNNLFKQYFAADHIKVFLNKQNFYVKQLDRKIQRKKRKYSQSSEDENRDITESLAQDFLSCKQPCPQICITDKAPYTKEYFYLDTLGEFTQTPYQIKWMDMPLDNRSAFIPRCLYEAAAFIVSEVCHINKDKHGILIFLPGYAEIQTMLGYIKEAIPQADKLYEILELHSTTINTETKKRLHDTTGSRAKIIVATNIAQSSITIHGVKYVIDFCMTKEIHYSSKSKLENLQLIWASQASCNQRAGRTGRVCSGYVFRLVQKSFFQKLPRYSTPEIQRSSLDRLILRIKILHESETDRTVKREQEEGVDETKSRDIFRDPGRVLGKAIQPPSLKNIDAALKSLLENGGITLDGSDINITNLGRFYVDCPIDIIYARMLILSIPFGVFEDILTLIAILSQNKVPFRRESKHRSIQQNWSHIYNDELCDFYAMVQTYKARGNQRKIDNLDCRQVDMLIEELRNRVKRLQKKFNTVNFSQIEEAMHQQEDYEMRFKLCICGNFIMNIIAATLPINDEKREVLQAKIRKEGLDADRVIIVNSQILNKNISSENIKIIAQHWGKTFKNVFKLANLPKVILTRDLSCVEFGSQKDVLKILFFKYCQENRRRGLEDSVETGSVVVSTNQALMALGDMVVMREAKLNELERHSVATTDPFSINRVVLARAAETLYLVTNSKADKVSSISCKFTSMLPNLPGFCSLMMLIFCPFVGLKADRKNLRYDMVRVKKDFEVKITCNLIKEDIEQINNLRESVRKLYSVNLEHWLENDIRYFWLRIRSFLFKKRSIQLDQLTWQSEFLRDSGLPPFEYGNITNKIPRSEYYLPIVAPELNPHYFSPQSIGLEQYSKNLEQYNNWKVKVLSELDEMVQFLQNDQAFIVCGVCSIKVCSASTVGQLQKKKFRTFSPIQLKAVTREDDCDSFTMGLMYNAIDTEYQVQCCRNGHPLAIKMQDSKQYKFTSFSNIKVLYPGAIIKKEDFNNLDYHRVKMETIKATQARDKMAKVVFCRICNDKFQTLEQLKKHLKQIQHIQSVVEFKQTLT